MHARFAPLACTVLLACTALLTACAPAPQPTRNAELPEGVSVSVYQSRTDLAVRQLQVTVHNESAVDLEIDGLVFDSDQFVGSAVWAKRSTTIAAGRAVDLPVALPEARCGDDAPEATASIDFALPDGARGSARLPAADPSERMPRLAVEDCLGQAAARYATLSATTPPRVEQLGGALVARLDLLVEPLAADGLDGALLIEEARGTVLLALADPLDGSAAVSQPVALTVDGRSQTSAVTLTLVPARCDPHAVAEDKRGTVFPLRVTVEGTSGTVYVAADSEVKAALYDFVRAACAP
jgi:hypothetical protein